VGACVAFGSAVLVWAWLETTFLLGAITGPRRQVCDADCHGLRHFGHAVQTILYHELATLAAVLLVCALSWGAANPFGLWTFLVLWAMRVSAKLNLHFGVPNAGVEMLPPHLKYLAGYFRQGRLNALFPVSVLVGAALSGYLIYAAWQARSSPFEATGLTLVATLSTLGLFEHLMLALSLPADTFWRWLRRPDAREQDPAGNLVKTPGRAPESIVDIAQPVPVRARKPIYGSSGTGRGS
jgi:putative photosynthetic complex assembly protein 2